MTPETENKEEPVVGQDDFRQLLRAKMVAAVRLTLIEILSRWTGIMSHLNWKEIGEPEVAR